MAGRLKVHDVKRSDRYRRVDEEGGPSSDWPKPVMRWVSNLAEAQATAPTTSLCRHLPMHPNGKAKPSTLMTKVSGETPASSTSWRRRSLEMEKRRHSP